MKHQMNRSKRTLLIVTAVVVVAILAAFWATSRIWFSPHPFAFRRPPAQHIPGDIEIFYTAETVVSSINVALLIVLLFIYVDIYGNTRSEFTVGLIIFSMVLLLNALASNPIVIWAFGFRPFGLGPFAMLPDLFTSAALVILLYLSLK